MNYFKLSTSNGETRWINLARVSRVTLAKQASNGRPVLVIIFNDGDPEARISISGVDAADREAIAAITKRLDELAAASS